MKKDGWKKKEIGFSVIKNKKKKETENYLTNIELYLYLLRKSKINLIKFLSIEITVVKIYTYLIKNKLSNDHKAPIDCRWITSI